MKSLYKHIEEFKVKTYHADYRRRVSPNSVLGYMEEVATNHARKLGFGYHVSADKGFFWILRSCKFEFKRVPLLDEIVTVTTWPGGIHGLKALRRFEFKVGEEVVGNGYHYWLMATMDKMKPFVYKGFADKMEELPITEADFFRLKKIRTPENMLYSYDKVVMNNDLDWNNHVNNVKYASIIYNAIPKVILDKSEILSFHIDYLKECKHNDILQIFYKVNGKEIFVEGKSENVSMFKSFIEIK
ncbi:thioesterase [Mycoplasmatota bacterium WC30]